jgi:signal transduction histidine kinase/CheY-like chemotaxis protein
MPQERILVAEDEADVRELCLRALKIGGYNAVGVGDGQQAVKRASEERFDLLLTDIKMPNLGGLDAYRAIHTANPDMVAVVMTGFGTMEAAIEALKLGVSEFVLKPFRTDDLNGAVGRALARRRLERENARLKALIPLFDLSRVLISSTDLATISQKLVSIAQGEMHADSVSLMLLDRRKNEFVRHAVMGPLAEKMAHATLKADDGIVGFAVQRREPAIFEDEGKDDVLFEVTYGARRISSAVSLPLLHQDQVVGILNVAKIQPAPRFTEGDVEFLSVLASQAAVAIENARLFGEIQEAYHRLSELDYLKSEFIAIASHELRSPLAVVLAYATLLEEEAPGPMREHLVQVLGAATQLKSIIDEMVSLRHIDTGDAQMRIEPVLPRDVFAAVLDDLRPLAEKKSQQLTVALPATLPAVRSDEQVLHLVISNLLSNAIKFTPEGGAIQVSASATEEQVTFAIRDTGIGIPAEELERIFERFYQVEDSLRRKHGGIGLGLAIAREMAELINARIWAESVVGQGSTFYVALPRA